MHLALGKLPQGGSENHNTNHLFLKFLKIFLIEMPTKNGTIEAVDTRIMPVCHHVSAANCSFVPSSKIALWNNAFALAGLNC